MNIKLTKTRLAIVMAAVVALVPATSRSNTRSDAGMAECRLDRQTLSVQLYPLTGP